MLCVFAHRAVGGEARCQACHAFTHPRDPGGGNAFLVAGIELGDHLAFEPFVERLGFGRVPSRIGAMFLAIPQRPAHFRDIGFGPPAIQFREIDASVDEHLHAARSTRLPRPPWRVDPDIHPLHQALGQMHIVITEEDRMRTDFGLANELYPFLDQSLSRRVRGMGLAREDELHRSLRIG